jgi:hypothetical protein
MAEHIEANRNVVRICDVWSWHESLPEIAYLYGPTAEVSAFEELATKASLSVPWPEDRWFTAGDECNHWLWYVYAALRNEFPSFFYWDNVLRVATGPEGREIIYTFWPEQEAEAKEQHWAGIPQFRETSLRIDPFEASARAIDATTGEDSIRATLDAEARRLRARTTSPGSTANAAQAPATVPTATTRPQKDALSSGACEDERRKKLTHALACLLTIGPNAARIAREVDVPRGTLLGWPDFRERYDQMKADRDLAKRSRRHGRRAGDRNFEADEG